jgi:hypothetical protein
MWNFRYDECHKQRCGLLTDPEETANFGCPFAIDRLLRWVGTDDSQEIRNN